jgi:hypothetical protein
LLSETADWLYEIELTRKIQLLMADSADAKYKYTAQPVVINMYHARNAKWSISMVMMFDAYGHWHRRSSSPVHVMI